MPATPPIPAAQVAKIKARSQSVRFSATLREVRQFRAYCCNINSDAIMGVSKEPVIVLDLSPNPVCLGNSIGWDFTGSYAPGSTITSRSIDWGDGNSDDPAGVTGTHTYGAEGTYTVTATVTEGTGISQTIEIEVNVVDCTTPLLARFAYVGQYGGGVWFQDFTAASPAWEERNNGLVDRWWLAPTVTASDVVAVYQPLGAQDQADSYVNLANPGTNDAAPGNAPTWAAATGWTFDGAADYLTTGITPTSAYTVIVAIQPTGANYGSTTGSPFGEIAANANFAIRTGAFGPFLQITGLWGNGSAGPTNTATAGRVTLALTNGVVRGIYNNTFATINSPGGTFPGAAAALYLGAENSGGAANFFNRRIVAVAVYNRVLTTAEQQIILPRINSLAATSTTRPFVNYLLLEPGQDHLSDTTHRLWCAADAGLYRTANGGRQWSKVDLPDPSNAEFGDVPAAEVGDLRFIWVGLDPTDKNTVYCEGVTDSPARIWIYKSTDYGVSWTSRGVTT